eukprot:gene9614-12946_t
MSSFFSTRSAISVISWNVWFDTFAQIRRYDRILSICALHQPDFICFQEVTTGFIDALKHSALLMNDYSCSDENLDGSTVEPYGVLILTKRSINAKFCFYPMPSRMERKLLTATCEFSTSEIGKSAAFCIGTVHLESLNSANLRKEQLQICNQILSNYENSILCGDFNFCSYRNFDLNSDPLENDNLKQYLSNHIDMWEYMHPNSPGYTFDTVSNEMLARHRFEQMRYDRICYNINTSVMRWIPSRIILLGNKSVDDPIVLNDDIIEEDKVSKSNFAVDGFTTPAKKKGGQIVKPSTVKIFPSDHFGLLGVFEQEEK